MTPLKPYVIFEWLISSSSPTIASSDQTSRSKVESIQHLVFQPSSIKKQNMQHHTYFRLALFNIHDVVSSLFEISYKNHVNFCPVLLCFIFYELLPCKIYRKRFWIDEKLIPGFSMYGFDMLDFVEDFLRFSFFIFNLFVLS